MCFGGGVFVPFCCCCCFTRVSAKKMGLFFAMSQAKPGIPALGGRSPPCGGAGMMRDPPALARTHMTTPQHPRPPPPPRGCSTKACPRWEGWHQRSARETEKSVKPWWLLLRGSRYYCHSTQRHADPDSAAERSHACQHERIRHCPAICGECHVARRALRGAGVVAQAAAAVRRQALRRVGPPHVPRERRTQERSQGRGRPRPPRQRRARRSSSSRRARRARRRRARSRSRATSIARTRRSTGATAGARRRASRAASPGPACWLAAVRHHATRLARSGETG